MGKSVISSLFVFTFVSFLSALSAGNRAHAQVCVEDGFKRCPSPQSGVPSQPQQSAAPSPADSQSQGSQTMKETWVENGRTYERTTTTGSQQQSESGALPQCAEPAEKAQSLCRLGDAGSNAQLQMAINQATQMMQSGGTEKACKAAKMVQALAGMANGAHAGMCQAAIASCVSSCRNDEAMLTPPANNPNDPNQQIAERRLRATKAKIRTCKDLQAHVIASGMAAFNNAIGFASSAKCQKAVTTNTQPGGSPPPPMDCTNPMMASMPSCVCSANPADPVCSGSNVGLGDGAGFASDNGGAIDGGMKDPEMFGFDDEIAPLESSGQGGGGSQASSGGGGGGMNGGGGAGALPPEEMGGGGEGPYNTDIMGGLTGGGGSGGGSYGSGGGSGGGSSGGSMLDTLAEKFNLKGFLPSKADFKNRGLASGSGADGITGPNGPSLFEKVSARYHKKQPELLP